MVGMTCDHGAGGIERETHKAEQPARIDQHFIVVFTFHISNDTPGVGLVPDYDARIVKMREAGMDRNTFVRKVYAPVLKQLGVDRHEVRRAHRAALAAAR